MHTALRALLLGLLLVLGTRLAAAEPSRAPRLVAWSALPHRTRTPGPSSGQFIKPANGVLVPFANAQPVPGWSGLLANRDGSFLAMPDNGFGSKANSSDYVLGFYTVMLEPKTRGDGTRTPGSVSNRAFTAFRDPNGVLRNGMGVDLTITADRASYSRGDGEESGISVDSTIRSGRLLTGYDLDVESVARARDGTLWVGDEFGPYLLHFAADGTLLDEPVPHPTLKSPHHAEVLAGSATPTLGTSRGFEALAFDAQKRFLYALPESAPSTDALRAVHGDERVVEIFQFDPTKRAYTGRSFKYRKEGEAEANSILIGDMANVAGTVFVVIERDSLYGASAALKRLYLVDLGVRDARGILKKRLLVDLLDIDDPRDLGGDLPGLARTKFSLPFDSIECVHTLDAFTLAVAVDTNFPSEAARNPGAPDDTELIELRFPRPIREYAPKAR